MSAPDTKTCILNAAEKLFAQNGFHNTSLRGITSLAKVNLAAVNYHFGSKDALLQAVIERRLLPLNRLRQEKLAAVLTQATTSGAPPATKQLLRAFIEPTLAFRHSGPGAEDFIAMIGRALSEPDQTVRNCFLQLVMPLFQQLFKGMQQALPQLPSQVLLTRLQFTLGAMSQVMCNSARPALQLPGLGEPLTDDQLADELIGFVCAGLEAQQ
ncbi:MAG TPA: TetR family transcriptional regulator [Malonomonas sp.]